MPHRTILPLAVLVAPMLAGCSYAGLPSVALQLPVSVQVDDTRRNAKVEKLNPAQALAMVNAYRASKGIAPLVADPGLMPLAQGQADLMARYDSLDAARGEHEALRRRLHTVGYAARTAGENIAVGQLSFPEVFKAWQDSWGHNRNLLDPDFTHVAIAAAYRPDGRHRAYWAIVFSRPR